MEKIKQEANGVEKANEEGEGEGGGESSSQSDEEVPKMTLFFQGQKPAQSFIRLSATNKKTITITKKRSTTTGKKTNIKGQCFL
jgi:hypothetical protein